MRTYDINIYERPSVAVDVAVFTARKERSEDYRRNDRGHLSLLLIKRGEHPYKNKWALPGGFVRGDETVEECAFREITEETGLVPSALMPAGIFSKPQRDVRGRVISCAFASAVCQGADAVCGMTDAIDAKWFDVSFDGQTLTLKGEDTVLSAVLKVKKGTGGVVYEAVDSGELAFDHAEIVASALTTLRGCAGRFDILFDFLPETFTLTEVQMLYENLLNTTVQAANFRRLFLPFVEETDEFVSGGGHRPAKLFKRKSLQK